VSAVLTNGDTLKQLLASSRNFLYKNKSKWSENQIERASLLFALYPDIEKAYNLAQEFRNSFEKTTDKIIGLSRLAKWREKVNQSAFKSFNTISRSIMNHYQTILNYFDNRSKMLRRNHSMPKYKLLERNSEVLEMLRFSFFGITNIYA
jgi:transposase